MITLLKSYVSFIYICVLRLFIRVPFLSKYLYIPKTIHLGSLSKVRGEWNYTPLDLVNDVIYKPVLFYGNKVEFDSPAKASESFLLELNKGRIWGQLGAVVSADGIFLDDVSHAYGLKAWKHPIWKKWRLAKPRYAKGISISLAGPGAENYFHWMAQLVGKFHLCELYGIALKDIDRIFLSHPLLTYQRETLDKLFDTNIPEICVLSNEQHYECEKLICTNYLTAGSSLWAINYIRKNFLPNQGFSVASKRLYISRKDASTRRIINEEKLILLLEEYDFEEVLLDGMNVSEQAELFSKAEIVIAPHGAGLTNLIFAPSSCRVLELFSDNWLMASYYFLSNQCGHEYHAISGNACGPLNSSDYTIDLIQVKEFLDEKVNVK